MHFAIKKCWNQLLRRISATVADAIIMICCSKSPTVWGKVKVTITKENYLYSSKSHFLIWYDIICVNKELMWPFGNKGLGNWTLLSLKSVTFPFNWTKLNFSVVTTASLGFLLEMIVPIMTLGLKLNQMHIIVLFKDLDDKQGYDCLKKYLKPM